MSQRIMQYQAALQLAQQAPDMYDMPELHRQMLEVLGIENVDKVIPNPDDFKPTDPVTENMNFLNMKPNKAFEFQDHEAHIAVHMAGMQDPEFQQQSQQSASSGVIMMAVDDHIREHLAFQYREEIENELGTPLPPIGEPLPADVEKRLSDLVAQAAEKLTARKQQQAQQQQIQEQLEDPIIQQRNRELDIQEGELMRKAKADEEKAAANRARIKADVMTELKRIESDEKIEGAKIGQKIGDALLEAAMEGESSHSKEFAEGIRLAIEIQRELSNKGITE
jgi:hypothetical protein